MTNGFKISVPVVVLQRKDYWFAYCPFLKTFGYSATDKEAALKDFDAAINTFFYVQAKLGTLNQTLLSLGWKQGRENVAAPDQIISSDFSPYRSASADKTTREILVPA